MAAENGLASLPGTGFQLLESISAVFPEDLLVDRLE